MIRVIQIIIVLAILGVIIYRSLPFIRRLKGTFKKIHLNEKANLSDVQYRMLSLGAIYSEQQSAYINSLDTGIPKSELQSMLRGWWQVNDEVSAKETLGYLLDNVIQSVFPVVIKAYKAQDASVIESYIEDKEKTDKAYSQLQNLTDNFVDLQSAGIIKDIDELESLGTDGWELGRLVYVTRMCYDVGFISEHEAWTYISRANQLARNKFKSWKEFGYSYVVGRSLWSGIDSANSGIAYIANYLLAEPRSPWAKLTW